MKKTKQILIVVLELVFLIVVEVICYFSDTLWWITMILTALVITVVIITAVSHSKNRRKYLPEKKWGRNWQRLVDEGKLSTTKTYKCRPYWCYLNKKRIEECFGIKLPGFEVLINK